MVPYEGLVGLSEKEDSRLGWGPEPGGSKRAGLSMAALFSWLVAMDIAPGSLVFGAHYVNSAEFPRPWW